jgi:hypothetical protein
MDHIILKKKLSTYLSNKGYLRNVSEEVLYEVIVAWENWNGTAAEFYRSIGFTPKQMASLIGKAKKLKRQGYYGDGDFKKVQVEGLTPTSTSTGEPCIGIEVTWHGGKVIRFAQVDMLVDFLKKAS